MVLKEYFLNNLNPKIESNFWKFSKLSTQFFHANFSTALIHSESIANFAKKCRFFHQIGFLRNSSTCFVISEGKLLFRLTK